MNEENEIGEVIDSTCFGEYGSYSMCPRCYLKERCKKFMEAEQEVSRRYKGKYTGVGKEKGKDKF